MRWATYEGCLVKLLLIVGSVALLVLMVVVSFNMFGRWVGSPIVGTIEIAGLSVAVGAAIAIPYAAREKRNVVVDVLASHLPPRMRGLFDAFTFLLGLAIVGFVVYIAFKEAHYAASFGEVTLVVSAPTSPIKYLWAIGLLLLFLVLLRDMVRAVRKAAKR